LVIYQESCSTFVKKKGSDNYEYCRNVQLTAEPSQQTRAKLHCYIQTPCSTKSHESAFTHACTPKSGRHQLLISDRWRCFLCSALFGVKGHSL